MAQISVENARSAVLFHLASKPQTATGGDPLTQLASATLQEEPREIFDLNGELLFYDFAFLDSGTIVGYARAAADDRLTAPVYFLAAVEDASVILSEEDAQSEIGDFLGIAAPLPLHAICYSFPKVGYLFEISEDGDSVPYVVDIVEKAVFKLSELPELSDIGDPLDDIDGLVASSVFDAELPEAGGGVGIQIKSDLGSIFSVASEILPEGAIENDLSFTENDYERLKEYFDGNPPAISTLMLPVDLIPQITPVYCAAACGQMILKFFGIELDQEDVATAMNVGEHGATNRDQFAAYKALSSDNLAPSFDKSPTFEEAKAAVDQFIPMKSGVPGHARVVRGWKRFTYLSPVTGEILRHEEWLLVNDPYPAGTGEIRWESLGNHNYRNFIYAYRS